MLADACTGSGKPNIHKTPPLPALQPGDYTTTPNACSLLTTGIVAPIMPKRVSTYRDDNSDSDCLRTDLAYPDRLFAYVNLEIIRHSPDPFPNGITATENARRDYQKYIRAGHGPEQHTVPGMGDEAIISRRDMVIAVVVRKRNLVLQMTCDYRDTGYNARAAQTCLAMMRRSFTRLH
jgi:hypothetical protein